MWIEEAEEFLKGYLPYYLLIVLPIFVIVSPIDPIAASQELTVYRMQQFDIKGTQFGCISTAINLEARALSAKYTSRHCVVAKIQNLTPTQFENVRTQAGGMILVLPQNYTTLTQDEREHIMNIEHVMLMQEVIQIPIYFVKWSKEIENIVNDIAHNSLTSDTKGGSATDALLTNIAGNGYQIVINPGSNNPYNTKILNVYGMLPAKPKSVDEIPTIIISANYDAFGVSPELSVGSESNGSGVAMLMELLRLFTILYSNPKTQGNVNLVFLLTGGAKINYYGSSKFTENLLKRFEGETYEFVGKGMYVLCLDSMSSSDTLYMHITRSFGEAPERFHIRHFHDFLAETVGNTSGVRMETIVKRLPDGNIMSWEHSGYLRHKYPAFAVSTIKSYKDPRRKTMLDTFDVVDLDRLERHTKIIAEALAKHVYNKSVENVFEGSLGVQRAVLESWLRFLASNPRPAEIFTKPDNVFVNTLKDGINKYTKNARIFYATHEKPNKPDFAFYESMKATMFVYNIKPAVFDLVLTAVIVTYLGAMYLVIQKFSIVYNLACGLTAKPKRS